MTKAKTPPLIVIVGETASGKSRLAIELAQRFDGEIICADSWTVRREVSIGTAKPTPEEQALVPHHLLDIIEPDEVFTAARFKELALEAIADIASRGKLPIMVGGTGLYIDGVIFDYSFRDISDPANRSQYDALTTEELVERITKQGIELGDVDVHNKRRLQRLLETGGAEPTRQPLRKNTKVLGLQTNRDRLRERVERRVDNMLKAGLEQEVQAIAEQYGWDCEALKGVGYAQWKDYFLGTQTQAETRTKIIKATMDLAKRQRTWFRRNKSIHWFGTPVKSTLVVDAVTTFLRK